jgi:hypothetical protein
VIGDEAHQFVERRLAAVVGRGLDLVEQRLGTPVLRHGDIDDVGRPGRVAAAVQALASLTDLRYVAYGAYPEPVPAQVGGEQTTQEALVGVQVPDDLVVVVVAVQTQRLTEDRVVGPLLASKNPPRCDVD